MERIIYLGNGFRISHFCFLMAQNSFQLWDFIGCCPFRSEGSEMRFNHLSHRKDVHQAFPAFNYNRCQGFNQIFNGARFHIGSIAHACLYQPGWLQDSDSLAHRSPGNLKGLCQIPFGGQLIPYLEPSLFDQSTDLANDIFEYLFFSHFF